MLRSEEKERYSRHLILDGFGEAAQLKLKQAKVLVVGAGGLGCPALQYLAAAGVGTLIVADNDSVNISNLQRQILFTADDKGKNKAETARRKLGAQNPHISIVAISKKITSENVLPIAGSVDLVIDGSDNFSTRYLLNDACVMLNKPLVYGAIHRFEGQVTVFNYNGGATYRCLFPEPPGAGEMPACNEAGVIGVLPGIIGTWQATEAIKVITGIGEPLSGKLLTFNLLDNTISTFSYNANAANRSIETLSDYEFEMSCKVEELDLHTLNMMLRERQVQLIDVREPIEYAEKNISGINIPLSQLDDRINEINPALRTVVHCKTGIRSQKAIARIKKQYPSIEIFNLNSPFHEIM